jgi:hypothetical protein
VSQSEQLTIDRSAPAFRGGVHDGAQAGERAARESLRSQVARLERELSGIVANGFPHISPLGSSSSAGAGPCL